MINKFEIEINVNSTYWSNRNALILFTKIIGILDIIIFHWLKLQAFLSREILYTNIFVNMISTIINIYKGVCLPLNKKTDT